jgi:Glyoxalase-like domain
MALTRRSILTAAGALALTLKAKTARAATVPGPLDHLLLGCNDLDKGIAFVEQHLGVRAALGGVHPGRGSRNALLKLGERKYLEIIAPDPAQPASADQRGLHSIEEPTLIGWAAHVDDIEAVKSKLTAAKIAFTPVLAGQRQRPSGETLRWKALSLADDKGGLLPFFIEWSKESPHPSTDAPAGCKLVSFEIRTGDRLDPSQLSPPSAFQIEAEAKQLGLDVHVARGGPALHAVLAGPRGKLKLP